MLGLEEEQDAKVEEVAEWGIVIRTAGRWVKWFSVPRDIVIVAWTCADGND